MSCKFILKISVICVSKEIHGSEQKLDDTESIELLKIPFSKAIDMVMSGEIVSNSTAHLILKVARMKSL